MDKMQGVASLLRQRWQTINPAHGIQRISAVVTFAEPIPSLMMQRAVAAVRSRARSFGLVREEPVNTTIFQIGPAGIPQAAPSSQEGIAFQDVQAGQVAQNLQVTKQALRFETANYTRWIGFRDQLSQLFEDVLPIVSNGTTAQSIGLEYVDFFYAVAEGPEDAGMIIDNQSQLIARRAFRRKDPFHSHAGWFDAETDNSRRLINVDVTVADAQGPVGLRRTITMRTLEAEQVIDMASFRAAELVQLQPVLTGMDALHVSLKARMSLLLTADAKRMISLGS